MKEMKLAAFRDEFTGVIENLDATGPVRLIKYNDMVAEIRSATPDGDRKYTKKILDTFGYFEDRTAGLTHILANVGVNTLDMLGELAERHKEFVDAGVVFDSYPEHCLADSGPVTVDEALARLYFGDDYPQHTDEPYAWFLACARLQAEAKKRDMGVKIPQPNAYDEDEPNFVSLVISSGHTPDSLVQFGIQSLGQGVELERLADMLGKEPIPADVVTMKTYSDWTFEQLTKSGLPHGEAVAVFRQSIDTNIAQDFASAGIRTADEIQEMISAKVSPSLALRATRSGLTPEEWKVQVPKIQNFKYKGIETGFGPERCGILPFRLLVEAAEEGVSLVAWDNNVLKVRADQTSKFFHARPEERKTMYPWCFAYDDRTIDLGRAKVSPSFLTAFGKLMSHHFNDGTAPAGFADLAIRAHQLGLTTAMADAMSRTDGQQPKFSPDQLVMALKEGLSGTGMAHYLADQHKDPDQLIKDVRDCRSRQLMTSTFVATVENTPAWGTVKAAVDTMHHLIKVRAFRNDVYLKSVVVDFLADKPLDDRQVAVLLNTTAHSFGNRSFLTQAWRNEHADNADAVRELAKNYDKMRKEHSVS